jgi:uncharacterized protein (TIGR02118 family)
MIKLVFCLRRAAGMSREEFQRYWLETHAPLVRERAEALSVRRYVQLHSVPDEISLLVAGDRNPPEPFDGVAELWFDSLEAIGANGAREDARTAGQELLADERRFIDLERSPFFFADEHVVVGEAAPLS